MPILNDNDNDDTLSDLYTPPGSETSETSPPDTPMSTQSEAPNDGGAFIFNPSPNFILPIGFGGMCDECSMLPPFVSFGNEPHWLVIAIETLETMIRFPILFNFRHLGTYTDGRPVGTCATRIGLKNPETWDKQRFEREMHDMFMYLSSFMPLSSPYVEGQILIQIYKIQYDSRINHMLYTQDDVTRCKVAMDGYLTQLDPMRMWNYEHLFVTVARR